ncbi:hypothetical protein ACWCQM_11475 [Streptomyces sp. NPDC002125]
MSHRPYPNADRALRQVTLRHGSDCPRCSHRDHAHPRSGGQYVCSRELNGVPSCRECADRLLRLKAGPLGGMAESLSRINVQMPSFNFVAARSVMLPGYEGPVPNVAMVVTPGRAVIDGVSAPVHDATTDATEAHHRGVVRIFP